MAINSLGRFDLQRQIASASRGLRRELADIGGANTPEMKAAGNALAKGIRKQLATRGALVQGPSRLGKSGKPSKLRGVPSAPGAPPHRINSALYKSIGQEVVGGVRRIGSRRFTSRLLEGGVDADETRKAKAALAAGAPITRARRAAIARAKKRNSKLRQTSHLHIAPRPFMQRALDAASGSMEGEFSFALEKRVAGGGSGPIVRSSIV